MADALEPGGAFAETLGQWIHFADAITLAAVHGDRVANPTRPRPDVHADALAAIEAEFERVQVALVHSIAKSFLPGTAHSQFSLPAPGDDVPFNSLSAFAPYRRIHETHQRNMEARIQPLRANIREAVAKASPGLRKLAELDATLEKILRERENKLLAKLPLMLKKRFEQLYKEHQGKLAQSGQADDPAAWVLGAGWLARFHNDMQMLLQAELELRLQPALGLMEALRQDTQ